MHQLGPRGLFEGEAFEHAVDMLRQSAAAMRRQARGFVEHDDRLVHVEDLVLETAAHPRLGCCARFVFKITMCDLRRHSDRLAGSDAIGSLDALAIETNLSGAEQLLEPSVRQRRIVPLEPAVHADSVFVMGDASSLSHQIQRTSHRPANSARMESSAEPAI